MWLYVPSTSSPSAPVSACSTKDSVRAWSILESKTELSFTSKGKLLRPPSLRRLWKQAVWMQRLFGTISRPSTAGRGAGSWMASLRASRVSPIPSPANKRASTTTAGSGPTSLESFARLNRHLLSSKTCRDFFTEPESNTSWLTLPPSGSMRSGVISKRPPLALRISASACSSWPTVRATDGDKGGPNQMGSKGDPMLPSFAAHWATPDCNTSSYSNGKFGQNLRQQTSLWMTPDVPNGGRTLSEDAVSAKGKTQKGKRQVGLENQTKLWSTPRASMADNGSDSGSAKRQMQGENLGLKDQAKRWPSPMARDHKGGGNSHDAEGRKAAHGYAGLEGREIFAPGPLDPRWARIIADAPYLAPATEPGVLMLAHGMAYLVDESRTNQLREIGNGVVPLQAAVAFVGLARRMTP